MRLKPQPDWEDNLAKLQARLRGAQARQQARTSGVVAGGPVYQLATECADLAEATLDQLQQLSGGNRALLGELSRLDERLETLENSIVFRLLRAAGLRASTWKSQAGQVLLRSPLHPLYARVVGSAQIADPYRQWLAARREADPLRAPLPRDDGDILFSIVLPTRNARLDWLREAVDSVLGQSYPRWQLCIALDGAPAPEVEAYLARLNSGDARVTLVRGEKLGISGALNLGLEAAVGEYVAFLDHDDVLEPSALAHVHAEILLHPAEIYYSDEDYISAAGEPEQPNFKPGWSPQLLLSCMYMGHLLVVSSQALEASGGFRTEHDGAQDYDLVCRLTDAGARVRHVPRVLYHWRRHGGSTAQSAAAKPWSHDAGRSALRQSVARRGWTTTTVEDGPSANTYRLLTPPEPGLAADVIIPTRNATLLEHCLAALERTRGVIRPSLLVAHHVTESPEDARIRQLAARYSATLVPFAGDFDFASMNNRAAAQARGRVLVFLNDDVEAQTPGWLDLLCAAVTRGEVAIAGARLLYPSGTLQHSGIVLGMADGAGHLGRHLLGSTYWPWIQHTRDVSAVTGACMAVRTDLFARLGGFDRAFPVNYNDVDLCLRARQAGFDVVVEGSAVLTHHESFTRRGGTSRAERMQFYRRWGRLIGAVDPFYTPHLRRDVEDLSLSL